MIIFFYYLIWKVDFINLIIFFVEDIDRIVFKWGLILVFDNWWIWEWVFRIDVVFIENLFKFKFKRIGIVILFFVIFLYMFIYLFFLWVVLIIIFIKWRIVGLYGWYK